jgi:hypothetical protein
MHETIEGEVILIALDTGTYYSLRESGADVWEGVARGASQDEIVAALASRYDGSPDEIETAVADLLARLEEERLIEAADDGDASGWAEADAAPATKSPFVTPAFEKHTDMQDLILLDPVHEVDPRGWPHPAPSEPSAA